MNGKYELRKWCEGETTNLQLHVCDERGRTVFSSASYDEVVSERDRLNAGGAERQTHVVGKRRAIRLPDGTVRFEIDPSDTRLFP